MKYKRKRWWSLKFLFNYYLYTYKRFSKRYINTIEISITQKCTLKCKNCSDLMQYFEKPINYDLEEIKQGIRTLFEKKIFVEYVSILGGEPFLNVGCLLSVINELMKHRKKFKCIVITTNGTILPKDDILKKLKDYKILLVISDYGNLSCRKTDLKNAFKTHRINFKILNSNWCNISQVIKERSNDCAVKTYGDCIYNCYQLKSSRIYPCALAVHAEELKICKVDESNSFHVNDDDFYEKIIRMKHHKLKTPLACRYCSSGNFKKAKIISRAQQIKKTIPILQKFGDN